MSIIGLYLIFAMLAVMYFDVTRFIIPNWLVGSLLLVYPIAVYMSPNAIDWQSGLMALGIVFAIGYVVFAMKWMGGGDIKLITACALWVGMPNLMEFVFVTALFGGVFAVALWGLRKVLPHILKAKKQWPRILREGEPAPYGVAIAGCMLWLISDGRLSAILG
ncbi:MAG: A24 family peptidase [Rickettsiales bacterium]